MKNNIFRNQEIVQSFANKIRERVQRTGPVKIMHVCGSHERTVSEWGLRSLLPKELEIIPGPGCPVCVCAEHEIGEVIELAKKGICISTFGDMMRVRTQYGSMMDARSEGAQIKIVYSPDDAVKMAEQQPETEFVFFAVGFETSAAPIAGIFAKELPSNFSVLTSLKLTSPAVEQLVMDEGGSELDGLIAPGHVSSIVGAKDWACFPEKYDIPVTVAGFEPADFLLGINMILKDVEQKSAHLNNAYDRLVKHEGNQSALKWMDNAFEIITTFWRGIGWVEKSGLGLREKFAQYDARKKYQMDFSDQAVQKMPKGCLCHLVVLGKAYPSDCPLFDRKCDLMQPVGPCMVSEEGACRIWKQFGETREV